VLYFQGEGHPLLECLLEEETKRGLSVASLLSEKLLFDSKRKDLALIVEKKRKELLLKGAFFTEIAVVKKKAF